MELFQHLSTELWTKNKKTEFLEQFSNSFEERKKRKEKLVCYNLAKIT